MSKIKYNFISGVVQVDPLKNKNKPEQDIETSVLEATMLAFIEELLKNFEEISTQQLTKISIFKTIDK